MAQRPTLQASNRPASPPRAVADAEAPVATSDAAALEAKLDSHPGLVQGRLENGFEYVILPNRSPPNQFEAHLQVRPLSRLRCAALACALPAWACAAWA